MKLFVMGDPHLSFGSDKPMNIFGENWDNHYEKIRENWIKTVENDDIVVIPGDISWGLKTDEAIPDLDFIDKLPGKKIIMKGNHDLWWQSLTKLDSIKRIHGFNSLEFLYNDAKYISELNLAICGTRGWKTPQDEGFTEEDAKVWRRECMRLEASIQKALTFSENPIVFMHYPPFNPGKREDNAMLEILEKYNIKKCYFGHIHNYGAVKYDENKNILPIFKKNGVEYYLIASDYLEFKPEEVN